MSKISIVIPVFKARARISEALDSVRLQTYPRDQLEAIVVDDGSSDQCVRIARTFLRHHDIRGTVLVSDGNHGTSASLNLGWQAAAGDWIQFLDSDDLLAANKLELQVRELPHLPDVICSSWQRLGPGGDAWQPFGPATHPSLVEPVLLKLVSPRAGLLGPALFRKKSLEAVAGFSDGVVYPDGEHLMLKLWGTGGKFVEAPSPSPVYFVRQARDAKSRGANANLARQHLQNVVIAEAMLRQQKFGTLTRQERKEIAGLCDWSLSELYEDDWAAFQQYWQWLREVDPNFTPRHSRKLKLASRVLGYESAESLALAYRWIKSSPARAVARISNLFGRSRSYMLRGDAGAPSEIEQAAPFGLAGGRSRFAGAAALLAVAGAVALAGIMALGQLGEAARPAHPRLAEAPRPSRKPAAAEAPLSIPAAKIDRRGEIAPIDTPPEAKTASAAAPERHPAVADTPPLAQVAVKNGSSKGPAPVGPPGTKIGSATAAEPARAGATSASADEQAPLPPVKFERKSGEAAARVAPAEVKTALVIAPEAPRSSTSQASGEATAPAKRDRAGADAGPQAAPAATKTAPIVAPEPQSTSASPTPAQVQPSAQAVGTDRSGGAPRAPMLSPQERESAEKMVARGESDLADGNVALARQFFLRAATAGLARGALLLAATYDPRELARLGVLGLQPNPALARKWYERAQELGAPEAAERLASLVGG